MGIVIVIASGKGGTGKTSLTAGVASALALRGFKVLCVDADIGLRNLDIVLGMSDRVLMNFTDVIAGHCTLSAAAVQHPKIPNLYLLTAPAERRSVRVEEGEMRALLDQIRHEYDYCLIDAPAGLGSGFELAACGADRALIVTTTDASSLRDAQHAVMELTEFPHGCMHLVVNRVEKKLLNKLHRSIDDAMDAAGAPLLGVVPEDRNVQLAGNRETPLLLNESKGAAKAYTNIAARLCGDKVPLMKL